MKTIIIALILTTIIASSLYGTIHLSIEVEEPTPGVRGVITDYPVMSKPGEPMLPFVPLKVLLPQGHTLQDIKVEVTRARKDYQGVEIPLGQWQVPISKEVGTSDLTDTNNSLLPAYQHYQDGNDTVTGIYPGKLYQELGVFRKNGYDILLVNIYPYQYDIDAKTLHYYHHFDIEISSAYESSLSSKQNRFLITGEDMKEQIRELVINPEMIKHYHKRHFTSNALLADPYDPYTMIVITGSAKLIYWEEYIDWKNSVGQKTGVFTIEEIYNLYEGIDRQEQIRNFIIDAYQSYSLSDTPLEYVLIGGDDSIVPVRGMYCYVRGLSNDYEDFKIPSDVYYSNLDGNWDANNNQIYGELDDGIDWFAELSVGRVPAKTGTDVENFIHKTRYYSETPSFSNNIALMIGQNLDAVTWGADYMEVLSAYVPSEYRLNHYYQKDGSFNPSAIMEDINQGIGLLNHLGHANQNTVFGLSASNVNQMYNRDYGIAYSQGCLTCAFDYHSVQEGEAIGQRMVNAKGGFFTFIGNTRYGWYWPETTNGASQHYHVSYIDELFTNQRSIGKTFINSKERLVNEAIENGFEGRLWENNYMLWVYYTKIIFGDPSIHIHQANNHYPYLTPQNITFDDYLGDNDGIVNPGETFGIYIELKNQDTWADAELILGKISFENSRIELLNDHTSFSPALSGSTTNNIEPFIVSLPADVGYGDIPFHLEVSASGIEDKVFRKRYSLTIPVSLDQQHFPWRTELSFSTNSAPLVTNNNDYDHPVIITADISGNIQFIDHRLEEVFPPIINSGNMLRSISMGDINKDGNEELVLVNRAGQIIAFSFDGETVLSFQDDKQFLQTPVLADLTGDGHLEIVSLSVDKYLFAIDYSGELISGFPLQLSSTCITELAAADINNNGKYEIITGMQNGYLDVIDYTGSSITGFPVNLNGQIGTSPIVITENRIVTATNQGVLFVISAEGDILLEKEVSGRIVGEITAGDFNKNEDLELAFVTANGFVHLMDTEGSIFSGYPVNLQESVTQPPLIADINGDGSPNIIIATNSGNIYGLTGNGNHAAMLPAPLPYPPSSPLFIADIDFDGDFEIGYGTNQGISCIDYKLSSGNYMPWSVYRGNNRRTGNFADNVLTAPQIPQPLERVLKQNYPNPFNSKTSIPFTIDEPQNVNITVYNIKGQHIKTIYDDFAPQGETIINWNAIDDTGKELTSGVYLYKMTGDNFKQARKMLLLK